MSKRTPAYQAVKRSYALGQRRCPICSCQLVYNPGKSGTPYPKNAATFEHLVPHSKGGTRAQINSLVVCNSCNRGRRSKDWVEWIDMLQPPKKEWLLEKYNIAIAYHQRMKFKIKVDTVHIHINEININS